MIPSFPLPRLSTAQQWDGHPFASRIQSSHELANCCSLKHSLVNSLRRLKCAMRHHGLSDPALLTRAVGAAEIPYLSVFTMRLGMFGIVYQQPHQTSVYGISLYSASFHLDGPDRHRSKSGVPHSGQRHPPPGNYLQLPQIYPYIFCGPFAATRSTADGCSPCNFVTTR